MAENPLAILNLSPEEVTALAAQDGDSRRAALSLLRRYYALLFHPDRNTAPRYGMERFNGAIDALENNVAEYQKTFVPMQQGVLRSERERWLEQRVKEEQQRAADLVNESNRARLSLEAGKRAVDMKIARFEGETKRLRREEELAWLRFNLLEWYRVKLIPLLRIKFPPTAITIYCGDTEKVMVIRRLGYVSVQKGQQWQKVGVPAGFLSPEYLQAHDLSTSLKPDNITVRSPRFDPVVQGLSREPTKMGGVVVVKKQLLYLYGRIKEWGVLNSL